MEQQQHSFHITKYGSRMHSVLLILMSGRNRPKSYSDVYAIATGVPQKATREAMQNLINKGLAYRVNDKQFAATEDGIRSAFELARQNPATDYDDSSDSYIERARLMDEQDARRKAKKRKKAPTS